MTNIKTAIKKIPLIGDLAVQISKLLRSNESFPGSSAYWDKRYSKGGTSGSGSYNRLAEFKAEVINSFVKEKNINSVIDFGCGDGNQLTLANYPKYTGIDVSPVVIEKCKIKFEDDNTKEFFVYDSEALQSGKFESDLSMSIDVIFHLVEDEVFDEYMRNVFRNGLRYVIIYSSNFDKDQILHEKDRKFSEWVEANEKGWRFIKKIDNKYKMDDKDLDNTSKSDFYIYEKIG